MPTLGSANNAHSETQRDNWHHEQDRQDTLLNDIGGGWGHYPISQMRKLRLGDAKCLIQGLTGKVCDCAHTRSQSSVPMLSCGLPPCPLLSLPVPPWPHALCSPSRPQQQREQQQSCELLPGAKKLRAAIPTSGLLGVPTSSQVPQEESPGMGCREQTL